MCGTRLAFNVVYGWPGRRRNQMFGGRDGEKKSLICPEGKSMIPCQRYTFSFVPPEMAQRHALSPFLTLKGLFEPTRCRSRALNLPHALLRELHSNKDTVRCCSLGAVVPGHCQEQLKQTLILRLWKMNLLLLFQKLRARPGPPFPNPLWMASSWFCLHWFSFIHKIKIPMGGGGFF